MKAQPPKRSLSVSSAGKLLDRYFSGPYKNHKPMKARSLQKSGSQNSMVFPKIRGTNNQPRSQELAGGSRSQKQRDLEIESRVKKEIAHLRSGSSKKLQIMPRSQSSKMSAPSKEGLPQAIESWKDLKKVAPSSGYLYIECKSQPKIAVNDSRKVTLSNKWVLITEPTEQQLYSIDDYAKMLKKFESLKKITFFGHFREAKVFRKWKIISEQNQRSNLKAGVQRAVKKIYKPVYLQLSNIFELIRKYKFIGPSKKDSLELNDYPDYLFNSSLEIFENIHDELFVNFMQLLLNPIKEAMFLAQNQQEERMLLRKQLKFEQEFIFNYLDIEDELVEIRLEQRFKRLRVPVQFNKSMEMEYDYIKSTAFAKQFMIFFKFFKKGLFLYNEAYIGWVQTFVKQIEDKLIQLADFWHRDQQQFTELMRELLSKDGKNMKTYNPLIAVGTLQKIGYDFDLNEKKHISFDIEEEIVYGYFKDYAQYLMANLSFRKVIESYADRIYGISAEELDQKKEKYPQIELIIKISNTNDCYNCEQLLKDKQIKTQFYDKLHRLIKQNFQEVEKVVRYYNLFLKKIYRGLKQLKQEGTPSLVNTYLEQFKSKLSYLPVEVNTGLFALSFANLKGSLLTQIDYLQAQNYINVPDDFKLLFNKVYSFLQKSYDGIKTIAWNIPDIIDSYHSYQNYQDYRLSTNLNYDIIKLKGYLDVLNAKCPDQSEQALVMFLRTKQLKDRLDIKSDIFKEKLPKKLKGMNQNAQYIKESIWKQLIEEQQNLTYLMKSEEGTIQSKFEAMSQHQQNLAQIKDNMDILAQIKRIESIYFIEHDLKVNNHSYEKLISDIQLLKSSMKCYLNFKEKIKLLGPTQVNKIDVKSYVNIINSNLDTINENFLLLVSYEDMLRVILDDYIRWKQYFETIRELTSLTAQELVNIPLFKPFTKKGQEFVMNFEQCISLDINQAYSSLAEKKIGKIKQTQLLQTLKDFEALYKLKPFNLTSLQKSKNISSGSSFKSEGSKSYVLQKVSNFQQLIPLLRTLQFLKSKLSWFSTSKFLLEAKPRVLIVIENIDKIKNILQIVFTLKNLLAGILDFNQLQSIYAKEEENAYQEDKMLIPGGTSIFFEQYTDKKIEIAEDWKRTVNLLDPKTIKQLLNEYSNIMSMLKDQQSKMNKVKNFVSKLIERTAERVIFLRLLDTASILKIIRHSNNYFKYFYPINKIIWNDKNLKITSPYGQKIQIELKSQHKDHLSELLNIQQQISHILRMFVKPGQPIFPIDNISKFMKQKIPLQIVYALDQIFLNLNYLSSKKNSENIIKNIEGEIKLICGMKIQQDQEDNSLRYCRLMCELLIQSRIQIRTRLDNRQNQLWSRQILIIESFEGQICLRNFNSKIVCCYKLVDYSHLPFLYPSSEKMLLKICNVMSLRQNLVVEQTDLIKNVAARIMAVYYELTLDKSNVQKALTVSQEAYPIFIVGKIEGQTHELEFIYEELNKFDKQIEHTILPVRKDLQQPSIFLLPKQFSQVELNETLKLRFRSLSAVYPSPKLIMCSQMIINSQHVEKNIFLNIAFGINCLLIQMRSRFKMLCYSQLKKVCANILERASVLSQYKNDEDEVLIDLFTDYFECIGIDFQDDILGYVKCKNRTHFQQLSIYQFSHSMSNALQLNIGKIQQKEPTKRNTPNVQYVTFGKAFSSFVKNINYLNQDFIQALQDLYELSFSLQQRPIAIIGSYQSGKSLLLSYFHQFLVDVLGEGRLFWQNVNIDIFNDVLGTKASIQDLQQHQSLMNEGTYEVSWMIFQGFISSQNMTILDSLFNQNTNIAENIALTTFLSQGAPLNMLSKQLREINNTFKKMHDKTVVFELSNIQNIEPTYLSMMSKIYLTKDALSLQSVYIIKIRHFLDSTWGSQNKNNRKLFQIFEDIYPYMQKLISQLLVTYSQTFEWIMVLTPKKCLESTMTFFMSLFNDKQKQQLLMIYNSNNPQMNLCKLFSYSFYSVVQNYVQKKFGHQLEKFVYNAFHHAFKDQKSGSDFLSKAVRIDSKSLVFQQFEDHSSFSQSSPQLSWSTDTIETHAFLIYSKKFLKNLIRNKVPVLVLGQIEAGKSTMIKSFLTTYVPGALLLNGNNGLQSYEKIKNKFHREMIQTSKKLRFVIYVEDVSMRKDETYVEKYVKFIQKYGNLIKGKCLSRYQISSIFERREVSKEFYQQSWETFFIYFHIQKDYFQNLFQNYLLNKVERVIASKKAQNFDISRLKGIIHQQFTLARYCLYNFKKQYRTWFYNFQIVFLKKVINDMISGFAFTETSQAEDFVKKFNSTIFHRIIGQLATEKQRTDFKSYYSEIYSEAFEKQLEIEMNNKQAIMVNSIQRQKLTEKQAANKFTMSEKMIRFVLQFELAIKDSFCIMVNRVILSHNCSIGTVTCQFLNIQTQELLYCQNQTQFYDQLQKESEAYRKSGQKYIYYFIPLEQLATNPQILTFIKGYIADYESQMIKNSDCQFSFKFILEYSVEQMDIISEFLRVNIAQHARILNFHKDQYYDSQEITSQLLKKSSFGLTLDTSNFETNIKQAIKIFEELKGYEPPKDINKASFHKQYTFSEENFRFFINHFIQKCYSLLRQGQLKKKMLQISLSSLAFLFKQYKELKMLKTRLQIEQSQLREVTNKKVQMLKLSRKKFTNLQNENVMVQLKDNELKIVSINRQIEQIVSSQKIWQRVYNNAHMAISRSQLAELKYLFVTNYSHEIELFELIGKVVGQKTDKSSLKRCFSDINFMSRLKQTDIRSFYSDKIIQLQEQIERIYKRNVPNCCKNILEWISLGCRIGFHRQSKHMKITKLKQTVQALEEENKQIIEKNKIVYLQKEISKLENQINSNTATLATLQLKYKKTTDQIKSFQCQFVALIQFQAFCNQSLEQLNDRMGKIYYYCLMDSIETVILGALQGQAKNKLRQTAIFRAKKKLGNLVYRQEIQYYQLLEQSELDGKEKNILIKPKPYLSAMKKKQIKQINKILVMSLTPLVIIDPRQMIAFDTDKEDALYVKMNYLLQKSTSLIFQSYKLFILECDSWVLSVRLSNQEFSGSQNFWIVRYKHIRLAVPANIPIIFVMKEWGPNELKNNFRVFNLQFSQTDLEQIVKYSVLEQKKEIFDQERLFLGQLQAEKKFLKIVHFISKRYQSINLKNKKLISQLLQIIQQMNEESIKIKMIQSEQRRQVLSKEDTEISKTMSIIFRLATKYFPSQNKTVRYFKNIVKNSLDYLEVQGFKATNQYAIRIAIEFLTEGISDKQAFIFLYYTKIYAVEKGLATMIESQNLVFLSSPAEEMQKVIKEKSKRSFPFQKLVLYTNVDIERIFSKLVKKKEQSESLLIKMIESENLSFFNKLLMKKLLVPNSFKKQMRQIIIALESQLAVNNRIFLKHKQQQKNMFCVCDASYWVFRLKFPKEFKIYSFTDIADKRYIKLQELYNSSGFWVLYDDVEPLERIRTLQQVSKMKNHQVKFIMLLKEMINAEYQEEYEFVSFKRLIGMFEIKQIRGDSVTQFTIMLKRISKYNDQLIAQDTFNTKYINQVFFQKIQALSAAGQKYKQNDFTILHFQWLYFEWNAHFLSMNKKLSEVLVDFDTTANKNEYSLSGTDNKFMFNIRRIMDRQKQQKMDYGTIDVIYNVLKDEGLYYKLATKEKSGRTLLVQNISERQMVFKKKILDEYLDKIKAAHSILKNEEQITIQSVDQLRVIINNFSFSDFLVILGEYIHSLQRYKMKYILELDNINSELNLFLLFETFTFVMETFNSLKKENFYFTPQREIEDKDETKRSGKNLNVSKNKSQKKLARQSSIVSIRNSRRSSLEKIDHLNKYDTRTNLRVHSMTGRANDSEHFYNMYKNKIHLIGDQPIGLVQLRVEHKYKIQSKELKVLYLLKNTFKIKYIDFASWKDKTQAKRRLSKDRNDKRRQSSFANQVKPRLKIE